MKRSLEVVDTAAEPTNTVTLELDLGQTTVLVSEVGDGQEAARFAEMLAAEGGTPATEAKGGRPLQIVVRSTLRDRDALRRRAELEASADVVLGSARPAFAHWLASGLLGE